MCPYDGAVQLLRNWAIVYSGNFVGAVFTALMAFLSGFYQNGAGAIGAAASGIAGKVQ